MMMMMDEHKYLIKKMLKIKIKTIMKKKNMTIQFNLIR